MQTENIRRGNISSIINAVDADLEYLDILRTTARWDFDLILNDDEAVKLYDVYEMWQEQHYISSEPCNQGDGSDHDVTCGYQFLMSSRDYDQHKWLLNKITS